MTTGPANLRKLLWAVVVLATAALGVFFFNAASSPDSPGIQIGGPFKLMSARNGGLLDSESLKGKPYAMFFGFTHCPEVCPTTLNEMTNAYQELGDTAKDFHVYFVTVDPERDTAQFLNEYLSNFDPRIEGLVPTMAELPKIAKAFRVFYEKVPNSDGSYTMNHTATVYLFGRDGNFTGTLAYGEKAEVRIQKLRRLLEGKQ